MFSFKKVSAGLGVIILLSVVLGVAVFGYIKRAGDQMLNLSSPVLYTVEPGHFAHYVINRLSERQVLAEPLQLKLFLKLHPELSSVKTGTYELSPGMSVKDMFTMLSQGQEKQFSISLVEGLTIKDWLLLLGQHEHLEDQSLNAQQALTLFSPTPTGESLEGWLLPDTYLFTDQTPVSDVLKRAYQAMQTFLLESWENRQVGLPYESPYDALIMASIVEKETGLASERPRIAGVFVNRLRQNMRLQTDPTVIYGMGDAFDGNIRRKDLRTATPYNTYVIKGLPPTPIAMPSKAAIEAALHPQETDELFFVSKGDGSHQFSVTLKEHNAAVRKYQLKK